MIDATRILHLNQAGSGQEVREAAALAGVRTQEVQSVAELLGQLRPGRAEMILAEHPVADLDPGEMLDRVHALAKDTMVVFRLRGGSAGEAVRLARQGAYFCCDEGCGAEELADIITAAVEEVRSRRAAAEQQGRPWRRQLVGESSAMRDLDRIVDLVAKRRCTILITGETGTGKEVAARAIHQAGDRAHQPMVAINCSAIPEHLLEAELFGHTKGAFTGAVNARMGRFEEANHGTLFLDEIGDMPVELQAKLLRVLQEREVQRLGSSETIKVDVRVIAASNLDLQERVKQGRFREDLYYRLNVVPIQMPPLRERPGDIGLLARHFVAKVCRMEGIPEKEIYNETVEHLKRYEWPGNVRQLENMVEKAVVLSGDRQQLLPADFALPGRGPVPVPMSTDLLHFPVPDHGMDLARTLSQFEKMILEQALQKTNGNKTLAADLLRLKRTTLMSKLRVLDEIAV
jgi:DNA-binding NtrC family response regulator